MSKKYIEIKDTDEIVLVDNLKSKYVLKYIDGHVEIEKIEDSVKEVFSIEEINLNTLKCLTSLESFLLNCYTEDISNESLDNVNSLYDFMYNKINNRKSINYENLIDTKYYKVTTYVDDN